jgi:hypothetical protein
MPEPTQAAIAAAKAEPPAPLAIHEAKKNVLSVHVGRRVLITAAPGETRKLEIAFLNGLPFVESNANPGRRRSVSKPFATTVRGKFAFDCFLDGKKVDKAGYAGQIDVGPE